MKNKKFTSFENLYTDSLTKKGLIKYRNVIKQNEGITMVALVVTMVLHYYYCIKYSNSNGFLEAMI